MTLKGNICLSRLLKLSKLRFSRSQSSRLELRSYKASSTDIGIVETRQPEHLCKNESNKLFTCQRQNENSCTGNEQGCIAIIQQLNYKLDSVLEKLNSLQDCIKGESGLEARVERIISSQENFHREVEKLEQDQILASDINEIGKHHVDRTSEETKETEKNLLVNKMYNRSNRHYFRKKSFTCDINEVGARNNFKNDISNKGRLNSEYQTIHQDNRQDYEMVRQTGSQYFNENGKHPSFIQGNSIASHLLPEINTKDVEISGTGETMLEGEKGSFTYQPTHEGNRQGITRPSENYLSGFEKADVDGIETSVNASKSERDKKFISEAGEELYNEIFDGEVRYTQECDWPKISTLFGEHDMFAGNWTSRVMKTFSKELESTMPLRNAKALSLMEYLRQSGNASAVDISFFIKILGSDGFNTGQEKTICELYDELKRVTDCFERVTGRAVIEGLCRTHRWRECFEILGDIEMISEDYSAHSFVAEAAFHYGDEETGFRLLEKIEKNTIESNAREHVQKVYFKILEGQVDRHVDGRVLNMLNFMREYEVIPSEAVARAIGDWFCR